MYGAMAELTGTPATAVRPQAALFEPAPITADRIGLGLGYVLAAALAALMLPGGHGFSPLAPAAIVLLVLGGTIYLRQTGGWVSCTQAAFVFLVFAAPLNLVPLVALACMAASMPTAERRPLERMLRASYNCWWALPPCALLAWLAPGAASWSHWPAYVAAFGGGFLGYELLFVLRHRLCGEHYVASEYLNALAMDACLTPVGLAAAVQLHGAPGGALATMAGLTGLLAVAGREHRQRWTQTELALRDPLTGLANRALFDETLRACESRCARAGHDAVLLLVDLDDFKHVNDTLGHSAGDQVLRTFADSMRAVTRSVDVPARLGGDEFAVILAEPTDLAAAARVAQALHGALSAPITLADAQRIEVSFSVGTALFGAARSAQDALVVADSDLYVNKRSRKPPQARPVATSI